MKTFIRIGVLLTGILACALSTSAQVRTVALDTLGGHQSYVLAVNDLGEAVGWAETSSGARFPVLWDRRGRVLDLTMFLNGVSEGAAAGINDNHQVVGNYTQSDLHRAFIWTAIDGVCKDLGTLGGMESQAVAINEIGQVIGRSKDANGQWKLFVITPQDTNGDGVPDTWYSQGSPGLNGLMHDLGSLGGNDTGDIDETEAVNNKGVVVGRSSVLSPGTASYYHAFGWSSETGMVDLGTLGGDSSEALAVSDYGQVVGYSVTADGVTHAFVVRPQPCDGILSLFCDEMPQPGIDFTMDDLGTLGGTYSIARSVNKSGQVAGSSAIASGFLHACIWNGDTPQDLRTLGGVGQDTWSEASAMNESGQVIGRSGPPNCPPSDQSCYHGFFWSQEAGMLDLPPLDGDTRSWAVAISNTGFIAGISECLSDRYTHAVVWTTDSTPPVINIASPGPSDYLHSDTLVIDFSASDSSGLAGSPTAMLDGTPVTSGDEITLLSLSLGMHTLSVAAVDNSGNSGSKSVSFDIIATLDSLVAAVNYFAQKGEINDDKLWNSLSKKLNEAQEANNRENMNVTVNKLKDITQQINAQSGKHITTNAACLLITDAVFVISRL
jgi:probable HAF family extracellular repeat protein